MSSKGLMSREMVTEVLGRPRLVRPRWRERVRPTCPRNGAGGGRDREALPGRAEGGGPHAGRGGDTGGGSDPSSGECRADLLPVEAAVGRTGG